MRGAIFVNRYYQTEEIMYQPLRLQEELSRRGVAAEIVTAEDLPFRIEDGQLRAKPSAYDFLVLWDKDKYLLAAAEKMRLRSFNRPSAIAVCDDKMLTFFALAGCGVPMPKTLPGLLCYRPEAEVSSRAAEEVERALGYPLVVKESYGSLGRGERLVRDRGELTAAMQTVKMQPHLFQEFIAESAGRDLRVIVVGGKVAGGMLRQAAGGDFRSNLGGGGRGEAFPVDRETARLAVRIARRLRLDYCGIDFLFGKHGMLLCEVNSNAFFGGFEAAMGINVAALYAEHILCTLQKETARAH